MVERMPKTGPLLLYDVCAIGHFRVSHLIGASGEEAKGLKVVLSDVAYFIIDRRSKVPHMSLSAVVTI